MPYVEYERERADNFSVEFYKIIWLLIGMLGTIFQTTYQPRHGAAVEAVIVTLFIHVASWLAASALGPNNRNHVILTKCSMIMGALVPILLALIMFPRFGGLALAIWVCAFSKVAYDSYTQIKQGFHDAVEGIKSVMDMVRSGNANEEQANGMPDAGQQQRPQLSV